MVKELDAIKKWNDTIHVMTVFFIVIIGKLIEINYTPDGLQIENFKPSNHSEWNKLEDLLKQFKFLCLTLTFMLAQIPLEYFKSENYKLKRNFKTILMVDAAASACMNFMFSY